MCHQTVGLVQAQLEARGIVTAGLTMLQNITAKIRPPRTLSVPFPLGYPLGEPHAPRVQRAVLRALLKLCEQVGVPLTRNFDER